MERGQGGEDSAKIFPDGGLSLGVLVQKRPVSGPQGREPGGPKSLPNCSSESPTLRSSLTLRSPVVPGTERLSSLVSEMCVVIHNSVEQTAERFFQELRRRFYVTPKVRKFCGEQGQGGCRWAPSPLESGVSSRTAVISAAVRRNRHWPAPLTLRGTLCQS